MRSAMYTTYGHKCAAPIVLSVEGEFKLFVTLEANMVLLMVQTSEL